MFMVHYLLTGKTMIKKETTEQTTMDVFLKRGTVPSEECQAGPSGGNPEEAKYLLQRSQSFETF